MSKVSVFVEEHLVRELTFDVQDEDADARMIKAEKLAREQIKAKEVVLNANDFSGTRLLMVQDHQSDFETNWFNF